MPLRVRLTEITVIDRKSRTTERYLAKVFIDATYEGDLATAAGTPYRPSEWSMSTGKRNPWHGRPARGRGTPRHRSDKARA
jgi:hypothetical protein